MKFVPVPDRLRANATANPATGCLEWQSFRTPFGYGRIQIKRRHVLAHRVAWEITHGPIPDGLFVLHRCDNPPCINPEHLWLGTKGDNIRDAFAKGRMVRPGGERHPQAKLSDAAVAHIRDAVRAGCPRKEVAAFHGVSYGHVNNLVAERVRA